MSWLLRQLRDSPASLRVDVRFANSKDTASEILSQARERPERLLLKGDDRREPRSFRIALSKEMGMKRGRLQGSFVFETKQQTLDFYRKVLQLLRPWTAGAPKLPEQPATTPLVASPEPPPFTAPEARDVGGGVDPEDATRHNEAR